MKGSTTLTELENMPNKFLQTLWKLYIDTMRDSKSKDAVASEEMMDELEDVMT